MNPRALASRELHRDFCLDGPDEFWASNNGDEGGSPLAGLGTYKGTNHCLSPYFEEAPTCKVIGVHGCTSFMKKEGKAGWAVGYFAALFFRELVWFKGQSALVSLLRGLVLPSFECG